MLPDGRRIGAHLPLGHGMVRAADRAAEIGASVIQIFVDNPTAWRVRAAPPRELPGWRDRVDELGLDPVVVHASYLINLAGPASDRTDGPDRSVTRLAHELRVAPTFGARLVNVHVGSHVGTSPRDGVRHAAARIAEALAVASDGAPTGSDSAPASPDGTLTRPGLALEISAGSGDAVGATIAELADIVDAAIGLAGDAGRIGICLDTAHLWGGGYQIGDPDGVDALVEEVERHLGLDRLLLIHLNDSRAEAGSRSDRHTHLGAGNIGVGGLRRILTHPSLERVPYVLETPGMDHGYDAVNLERARCIGAGEPLEALPPEALTLRRERGRAEPVDD